MKKNLSEELKRMRELAGIINEDEQSSQGGESVPQQTQSPSIGNPEVIKQDQTPLPKQPVPEPILEEDDEVEKVPVKQERRQRRANRRSRNS